MHFCCIIVMRMYENTIRKGNMAGKPPADLPKGFRVIRKALAEADRMATSRQMLARELGISTNTIQRILVDGDVPDLKTQKSNRILHSWTRIVVRLALYFEQDPFQWVKMVDIDLTDRIAKVIDKEVSRNVREDGADVIGEPWKQSSAARQQFDSSFLEHLGRKILETIAPDLRESHLIKDELLKSIATAVEESGAGRRASKSGETKEEKYCLSCLASLKEEDNMGESDVYCRHCSDENGNLLPRETVLKTIAEWFMNWQKDLTEAEAQRRADHYMRSMPAWNQE